MQDRLSKFYDKANGGQRHLPRDAGLTSASKELER